MSPRSKPNYLAICGFAICRSIFGGIKTTNDERMLSSSNIEYGTITGKEDLHLQPAC
jgi:hypothetical protein